MLRHLLYKIAGSHGDDALVTGDKERCIQLFRAAQEGLVHEHKCDRNKPEISWPIFPAQYIKMKEKNSSSYLPVRRYHDENVDILLNKSFFRHFKMIVFTSCNSQHSVPSSVKCMKHDYQGNFYSLK